ncbi:MAG: pentapeptide repeat-containing protein [Cyanosarcina radialis HA8281-LM2]|nr:pentapeptide repeat-containing protein [Cyanosarcina radialis HA8281-LM2]
MLNALQVDIFRGAWNHQSYRAIALELNHEYSYIKDVGAELWQLLSQALGMQVTKLNLSDALTEFALQKRSRELQPSPRSGVDWGEAPDVSQFCGREPQLATLERWVIQDRCRLVAIAGIGGIGKTMLATQLAQQLVDTGEFEVVVWRSLRQAPPLLDLLAELTGAIAPQPSLPLQLDAMQRQLLAQLRDRRCLIVLDNVEAVLQTSELAGTYRSGYEDYGWLFQQLGEGRHQSSILLTSREIPAEVSALAGPMAPTRLLQLERLSIAEGEAILAAKGLAIPTEQPQVRELIDRYQGNPLALKIVAAPIQNLYDSNIAAFLSEEARLFRDIRDLLASQFDRLSDVERQVMYWLAIDREPATAAQLQIDLMPSVSPAQLRDALISLDRRSLIEKIKPTSAQPAALMKLDEVSYTQQPVVMEYVTEQLIKLACQEMEQAQINFLRSHALVKVQAKDYVRDIQLRLLVQPILARLIETQGGSENLKNLLLQLLRMQQIQARLQPGYFAGNAINLLRQLGTELSHLDFSHLTIWQADLRTANLQGANFSRADLSHSIFTQSISEVFCVAFSPDAQKIATGHAGGEICVWQVEDGQQIAAFWGIAAKVNSLAFSADGESLVIGNAECIVKRLHIPSQTVRGEFHGHAGAVWSVALSADGRLLASGGEDLTIGIWDMQTGARLKTLEGHRGWLLSLAFAPSPQTSTPGYLLASGSADGTIRLWNVPTGKTWQILEGHARGVSALVFSPDGRTIASTSADGTIRLWDTQIGPADADSAAKLLTAWQGHDATIWTLAFSPDGQTLASGSEDRTIKLWDVETRQCYRTLRGHTAMVKSICFANSRSALSPDGLVLASVALNQSIRLWDARTGHCLKTWQGYSKAALGAVFHPDGQRLASCHGDHVLRLWDVQTGDCLSCLPGHSDRIASVVFSPDGRLLASGSFDRTVRLWDVDRGNFLRALRTPSWVNSVTFSADGSLLASSGVDGDVRLWDTETGRLLRVFESGFSWVPAVAFSPLDRRLASGNEDGTVKLWDAGNAQCLLTLEGHARQSGAIAFDPTAERLASGSDDGTVKLWDLQTGQCLQTLEGHSREVASVSFHPDGNLLVSGSFDSTLVLWDLQQGTQIATLPGHAGPISSVAFAPGGQMLASSSEDGSIRLWDSRTGECLRILRADRPYERMNISGVTGLTDAQKESLRVLGAIER